MNDLLSLIEHASMTVSLVPRRYCAGEEKQYALILHHIGHPAAIEGMENLCGGDDEGMASELLYFGDGHYPAVKVGPLSVTALAELAAKVEYDMAVIGGFGNYVTAVRAANELLIKQPWNASDIDLRELVLKAV